MNGQVVCASFIGHVRGPCQEPWKKLTDLLSIHSGVKFEFLIPQRTIHALVEFASGFVHSSLYSEVRVFFVKNQRLAKVVGSLSRALLSVWALLLPLKGV